MGDKNSEDALKFAAGLIIAALFISLCVGIFMRSRSAANDAANVVDDLSMTLNESEYTNYNGQTISGNQVQSLVNQWAGDEICVQVIRLDGTDTQYNYAINASDYSLGAESTLDPSNCTKKTSPEYVNPSGKFECTVSRNTNGVITLVSFQQTR